MSGGVDSSVAAHLLVEQGHDVIGVFMRHGEQSPVAACAAEFTGSLALQSRAVDTRLAVQDRAATLNRSALESQATGALPIVERPDHKQGCCTAADAQDARRVADKLAIPFYALNLQEEFAQIIDYFVDEYTRGRTPNPCVQCNNWIKFGKLFDYADGVGAEYVATGHYARLAQQGEGRFSLLRGVDAKKDQSYVLFGIAQELLARMLLPVGAFDKPTIRRRAAELGLRVADKQDSQEICFVTKGRYDAFVRSRRDECDRSGEFVLTDGTVVGRHDGIEGFTIGQRKGLGVALGDPRFVVRIEPETRRVVLGHRDDLARQELTASRTNWHIDPPREPLACTAQIRYQSRPAAARVVALEDDRLSVAFDEPQCGIAPGQAVVCYEADRVLGGGWIE
jgi:tRNA-specific 2-thiouridylase